MVNFFANINLNKGELQNAVVQNLAAAPSTPSVGQIYFDTTSHKFGVYLGSGEGLGWQYFATYAELTTALALKQDNLTFETGSPLSLDSTDHSLLKIDVATAIAAAGSTSNSKVASETAVRSAVNAVASDTMTFTNKTFDANGTGNTLSNIETDNFATGVIVTDLTTGTEADDTTIPSAKAVQTAIAAAQVSAMQYRGAWTIAAESATASTEAAGLTSVSVDLATFKTEAAPSASGNYAFTYDGSDWSLNSETVDLADYGITYEGTPAADDVITVAYVKATSDMSGLSSYLPIYKGDVFAITGTGPVIIGGIEYNPGDHLIANVNVSAASDLVPANFDKIDSTESADLVRLNATQTLTNKTIDADDNTIVDLTLSNLKSGVLVTDLSSAQADDTTIASAKAVQAAISAAAPGVDNVTIELYDNTSGGGSDHDLRLKDGGITMPKFNANALSLGTSETQANATLPSTAKVGELITAERSATVTLTNHTIDADDNTISDLTVSNFKSGTIVTTVGPATGTGAATDTELATAAATRAAIDAAAGAAVHKQTFNNTALTPVSGVCTWTVAHTLGSDVEAIVKLVSTGEQVMVDIKQSNNSLEIKFNASDTVAANTFTCVVMG